MVLLATVADDKISLVAGVTGDLAGKVKAGDLVGMVASQVGGKGGGRPDMAMGGGSDVAALAGATASVEAWVRERLV
ncbi:Alanine--tRNA ligase [compost metagenome]